MRSRVRAGLPWATMSSPAPPTARRRCASWCTRSWAEALAPVEPAVARLGEFLRGEVAAGRGYLPGRPARAARVPAAARRRQGARRRPGPLPDTGPRDGPVVLGGAGRAAGPPEPGQHLHRARGRPRAPAPDQRRPHAVGRPGRPAPQPRPHGRPRQAGEPPRPRLGGGDRRGPSRHWSSAAAPSSRSSGGATPVLSQRTCPTSRCIESPHPSPLSAHQGFFGSRPFSRANTLLTEAGADPVDWRLP